MPIGFTGIPTGLPLEANPPFLATIFALSDDSHVVGCFRFHLASHWSMGNEESSLHALLAPELFFRLVTVLHPMNLMCHWVSLCAA
jgi:hypothetical protein